MIQESRVMAESFLEEQLKRIREMGEQMSRAASRAAEVSNELARNRESQGPLDEVRDLRTYTSRHESREPSDDAHADPARRHTTRESSRRRR
jgi:hypothetical protein